MWHIPVAINMYSPNKTEWERPNNTICCDLNVCVSPIWNNRLIINMEVIRFEGAVLTNGISHLIQTDPGRLPSAGRG